MGKTISAFAAMALGLTVACTPIVNRHGYVPTEDDLAQFVPGVDTRDAVLDLLPPPTTKGVGENSSLYYVRSEFRTLGPFESKEVSRQVVAINVAENGVVTGISRYGLQDGRVVALSRRVTDDNIADVSFLRQLMGNLGRFDAGALFGGD